MNTLIPAMREELEKLHENPNYRSVRKIFLTGKHIVNLGRLYHGYIYDSISQIRKIPGHEDYTIEVEHVEKTREEIIKERGRLRHLGNENFSEQYTSNCENEVVKSRQELQDYISGMKTGKNGKPK